MKSYIFIIPVLLSLITIIPMVKAEVGIYCTGNVLVINSSALIDANSNRTQIQVGEEIPCPYGCDNTTSTCNPDPTTQNYIFVGVVIALFIFAGVMIGILRRR
jgi:hypothetical protein